MKPLLVSLPGNEDFTELLAGQLGMEMGQLEMRHFPDGETYLRYATDIRDRDIVLVCGLDRPDAKFLPLIFAANTAREMGAENIGLVAPYLAYMRQDRRFKSGEAVTSRSVAGLLSEAFDWLVTVDPHLHRVKALAEIYSIPARAVHAAPLLADWLKANVEKNAILIGPDGESAQWVSAVAERAGLPFAVLEKVRHGDRDVEIILPEIPALARLRPIFLDDIISSGHTMLTAIRRIKPLSPFTPLCVAVHGIFADNSDRELAEAGAEIVTTNTVPHASNRIDVSSLLAAAVSEQLRSLNQS